MADGEGFAFDGLALGNNWRGGISRSLAHSAVLNKLAIAKSKKFQSIACCNPPTADRKKFSIFLRILSCRGAGERGSIQNPNRIAEWDCVTDSFVAKSVCFAVSYWFPASVSELSAVFSSFLI